LTNPKEEDPFSILPQLPHTVKANHHVYQLNKITKTQIAILDQPNYGEKVQMKHKYNRPPERAIEPILG